MKTPSDSCQTNAVGNAGYLVESAPDGSERFLAALNDGALIIDVKIVTSDEFERLQESAKRATDGEWYWAEIHPS